MKKSFAAARDEKVSLIHELDESSYLIAAFEITPEGMLDTVREYYDFEVLATAKYGAGKFGRRFLVMFDLALTESEIYLMIKDKPLRLARAAAFIEQHKNLSIMRPALDKRFDIQ